MGLEKENDPNKRLITFSLNTICGFHCKLSIFCCYQKYIYIVFLQLVMRTTHFSSSVGQFLKCSPSPELQPSATSPKEPLIFQLTWSWSSSWKRSLHMSMMFHARLDKDHGKFSNVWWALKYHSSVIWVELQNMNYLNNFRETYFKTRIKFRVGIHKTS